MTATRRLAAILAADVAGYSRLMGADEEAACATGEGGARRPQGVPSTMLRSAVAAGERGIATADTPAGVTS